jgi:hypothetical protein
MNTNFFHIIATNPENRHNLFLDTANRLNTPVKNIEKDFLGDLPLSDVIEDSKMVFVKYLSPFIFFMIFACSPELLATNTSTVDKQQDAVTLRTVLFADSDRTKVQLSPNGQYITYLAPSQGILNIWLGHPNNPIEFKPVTDNTNRGISEYLWAYSNKDIIYLDDRKKGENCNIYRLDILSGQKSTLVSFDKAQEARLVARSDDHPEEILIEVAREGIGPFDEYLLNIITGKLTVLSPEEACSFIDRKGERFLYNDGSILDNTMEPDFTYLKDLHIKNGIESTQIRVISRSLDDKSWTVAFYRNDIEPHYYFYDRITQKSHFLFSGRLLDQTNPYD